MSAAAWRPLVTGAGRAAIAARIAELVVAMDRASAALVVGAATPSMLGVGSHCDRALVRAYLAQDDTLPDPDDVAGAALADAVGALGRDRSSVALYGGASNIGWCVAHLAGGDAVEELAATIDRVIDQLLPSLHYDLVDGLAGLGLYALERDAAGVPLATRILAEIESRARVTGAGLGWHTAIEHMAPPSREIAPDGCWNLGLSHGIPGVIALVARYVTLGIDVERATRLLDGAVAYVLGAVPPRAAGRFPAWVTENARDADHAGDRTGDRGERPRAPAASGRLAWCYGDLGVSLALLAAADARGNAAWRDEALVLARGAAGRDEASAQIHDGGLCHGAFGAMHLFARLHHATGESMFAEAGQRWLAHGMAKLDPTTLVDPTLLTGAGGIALALQAAISEVAPSWDRMLLVDVG